MVAALQHRRSALYGAVVCLVLLTSGIPFAPAAENPTVVPGRYELSVAPGDVVIKQNGVERAFLANGTTATIEVTVTNRGTMTANNIPVYLVWLDDHLADVQGTKVFGLCKRIDQIDGAEPTPDGTTQMGVATVSTTFDIPANIPAMGYNITAYVNLLPPAGAHYPTRDCGQPQGMTTIGGEPVATNDITKADNIARAYFVKDKKIDYVIQKVQWCAGDLDTADVTDPRQASCPTLVQGNDGTRFNQTLHNASDRSTYYIATVANVGDWLNETDYGTYKPSNYDAETRSVSWSPPRRSDQGLEDDGRPALTRWRYELNTTIVASSSAWIPNGDRQYATLDYNTSATDEDDIPEPQGSGRYIVGLWNISDRGGNYTTTFTIEPQGNLNQVTSNDTLVNYSEVAWADLSGNFTTSKFNTSSANPYPFERDYDIDGTLTINNTGKIAKSFNWRAYIDSPDVDALVRKGEVTLAPGATVHIPLEWTIDNNPDAVNHLRQGTHTIVALLDVDEQVVEPNEDDNRLDLTIFVSDANAPVFTVEPKATLGSMNSPELEFVRGNETFFVHTEFTDNDPVEYLSAIVNFTYDGDAEAPPVVVPMSQLAIQGENHWSARVNNLTFHRNNTVQNWTMRVEIRDGSGNVRVSDPKPLRIEPWPVHTEDENYLVPIQANNTRFDWADTTAIRFEMNLFENLTGVHDQPNLTHNLNLHAIGPNGYHENITWVAATDCDLVNTGNAANPKFEMVCTDLGLFTTTVAPREGGAGQWLASIEIKDNASAVRYVNRTFFVDDLLPEIHERSVEDAVTGSMTEVVPGNDLRVRARITDDNNDRGEGPRGWLNLTRQDGYSVNITLGNRSVVAEDGQSVYLYDYNVSTGRLRTLGAAGTFNASIHVRDETGNWAQSANQTIKIVDNSPPQLLSAEAMPALQEAGQPVTIHVRASDASNITAHVLVLQGSAVVKEARVPQTEEGNITYTFNITTEGNYVWEVRVEETHQPRQVSEVKRGTLAIRENLGPRFEIRSPYAVYDGQRYADPTPLIDILAYDADFVDAGSIQLQVDGQDVSFQKLSAPDSTTGIIVSYVWPEGQPFEHGDTVEVSIRALDNSSKKLSGSLNFTFLVDGQFPTTSLVSFEPRYRAADNLPWVVSKDTRFTLAADDSADGMPTEADTIRFRVTGSGNFAEHIYSGPFRLTDLPNVYTGPRNYTISYWAEDTVGNAPRDAAQVMSTPVMVDEAPPQLGAFFPQNQFINASLKDEGVGVDRAVVWHNVNGGTFSAIPMEDEGNDFWTATIPNVQRGQTITYYLQAWDRLNNTQTIGNEESPLRTFEAGNTGPTVEFTAPDIGSRVSRTVDLQWLAGDEDGDELSFIIYFKAPGRTSSAELVKIDNPDQRRYPLDTTNFADGEYTFIITASDGPSVARDEVTLSILNQARPVGVVTKPTDAVVPGETVLLTAEITKANAIVEARVYLDGDLVESYPMNDEGREGDVEANDGIYSVRVPVSAAGDYDVEIFAQYEEDGQLKSDSVSAGSFSAKLTPGYVLSEYAGLLALIALLGVAAVGVGIYVVMRRRG